MVSTALGTGKESGRGSGHVFAKVPSATAKAAAQLTPLIAGFGGVEDRRQCSMIE